MIDKLGRDCSASYHCGRVIKENDLCSYNGKMYVVEYIHGSMCIVPCVLNNNSIKTVTGHIADNLFYEGEL